MTTDDFRTACLHALPGGYFLTVTDWPYCPGYVLVSIRRTGTVVPAREWLDTPGEDFPMARGRVVDALRSLD